MGNLLSPHHNADTGATCVVTSLSMHHPSLGKPINVHKVPCHIQPACL